LLRWLAEFAVHASNHRWPQALHAAETGFALAIEAGTMFVKSILANYIVVALLEIGDAAAALQRSRELRPLVLPGPANSVIPFIGSSARCSFLTGDLQDAKRQLAQMFELCRTVEWSSFESLGYLYVSIVLNERRLDDAARLLGYAATASERAWSASRSTATRDETRAALVSTIGEARLAQLVAEGEQLDPESVCRLVLRGSPKL
jgi:hypothetical protein